MLDFGLLGALNGEFSSTDELLGVSVPSKLSANMKLAQTSPPELLREEYLYLEIEDSLWGRVEGKLTK